MRKFLIGAIVASMFAVMAPPAAKANLPQVGKWTCKIPDTPFDKDNPVPNKKFKQKSKEQTCNAWIPKFPAWTDIPAITDIGGAIDVQLTDKPGMPIKSSRQGIDNGGGIYGEGTCAAGFANGKLLVSQGPGNKSGPLKGYDFFYIRVGLTAVIVAVNQMLDEALIGVLVFESKAGEDEMANRCSDVGGLVTGASLLPLQINFFGQGLIVSLKKFSP